MSAQCRHEGRTTPPSWNQGTGGMRLNLTNTVITKLICPAGKSDFKCSDTEVSGLKVRGTAAQALLERGWGKSRVEVLQTHKGDSESFIEALQEVAERVMGRQVL